MVAKAARSLDKPQSLANNPAYVLLGEFGRAQGLKGELRLKSHTAEPEAIADYGALTSSRGDAIKITAVRPASGNHPDMLVVRVDGVATREAAEALNRVGLYIERDRLPQPQQEDEFFHADLIGLKVVDTSGTELGTVSSVANYGGGDILEVAPGSLMVPFTRTFVPEIDMKNGRVVIDYAESDAPEQDE